MGIPPDEHLPEVAPANDPQTMPDSSPQALTAQEAYAHQRYFDGAAKYPDANPDSAKFTVAPNGFDSGFYHESRLSPDQQSSLPWASPAPASTVTGLQAGSVPAGSSQFGSENEKGAGERGERICGLKKRIFYMVIAACIIVVSVVVGVGVGVSLASQQNRSLGQGQPSAPDGGSSNNSPTGETSSSPPPLPQPTNKLPPPRLNETQLDGPFKFQGWSGINFTGETTEVVRGVGITQFNFDIRSYIWDPNGHTCCVSFCNETVSDGGSYRCGVFPQPQSSGTFNRIVTLCGGNEITKQAVSCS